MTKGRMPLGRWPPPRWITVLATLVAAIVVFALVFDWNWLKGPIERRVSAATGREFSIDGDLDVDFGRIVHVRAERVRLGNAPWAEEPSMARFEKADIGVAFWPLLRGDLVFPAIHLERPRLLLQRNARGEANWMFQADDERPDSRKSTTLPDFPRVDQLTISGGEFDLIEPGFKTELHVNLNSAKPGSQDAAPPLLIEGSGRFRYGEFDLRGRIDSPVQLLARDEPYRIDLRGRTGATRAHVRGDLRGALQLQDFDVDFGLTGDDLGKLYDLVGLALPETPPYELDGRLSRAGNVLRYRDFKGRVGDSDIAGDLSLELGGDRPVMRGALSSQRLDLDDLAGAIGATPQTGEGESASREQRERAARDAADGTVLPERPFNLAKLRSLDADVTLNARQINAPKLPLESMRTHVRLEDRVLRLDPLDMRVAGGTISGEIILDARTDPITTTTDMQVRRLDLQRIFPKLKNDSTGRIAGNVTLAGKGNSVASMLATADGRIAAVMGPGRISHLIVELAGLDVAEALRYAVGKDKMIGVRCAYTDLDVEDGVMTSQALVFDTTDTAIVGAGKIDLRDEELDLELRPAPKDQSPIALRVPLEVGGTFKDPSFRPAAGPLAARAVATAVLYAVAPPAVILALLETGPGENVKCGEALAKSFPPAPEPQRKKGATQGVDKGR